MTHEPIETLTALCEILTRNGLTIAAARGALAASGDPLLQRALLVSAPDADEPNHVEVTLAPPLDPARLTAAFGEHTEAPKMHWDAPTEYLYYPESPANRAFTCAIIARIGEHGAIGAAVRRDPKL